MNYLMALHEENLPQLDFVIFDVLHLKNLYKAIHLWVTEEGYDPGSDKWMETLYLEKIGQAGKEHWVWWRCNKQVNSMFTRVLNIDMHTLAMKDVEVMHEGKKLKSNKGEFEIFINGILVMDKDDKWKKNILLRNKNLRNWFVKRFYKARRSREEADLYKDMVRLMDYVKQHLELKTFLHEYSGEAFIPKKGVKGPS